jgi:hypothetical protein
MMENKIFLIICTILVQSVDAQVGINTTAPTQTLDVNGNARVRTMTDINTNALNQQYNRKVMADGNGNLGFIINSTPTVPWQFSDNMYAVLAAPISSSIAEGRVSLNFNIPVTIPANTQAQIVINYNMPVRHSNREVGTIGYIGCTLYKSVNNGADTELEMGSRKYTVPGYYNRGASSAASAYGLPIAGFAVDIVSNTGTTPMNIVYKVEGYIEGNNPAVSTITFGMYAAAPDNNYNWGRGALTAQIFTKPVS